MKTLALVLLLLPAASAPPALEDDASAQYPKYDWNPGLTVATDLNRNGTEDQARLGVKSDSVALLIRIDSDQLPIIEIPIDGAKQFGICPGSTPIISVVPQSVAPLNALGETPHGYEICPKCMELVVGAGECDPIHFYWDKVTSEITWWRE